MPAARTASTLLSEIARKLRLNYVFGREFVELTQGSKTNPAYHGQATLSRWKISNPRVIHFQQQSNFWKPHWYLPKTGAIPGAARGKNCFGCRDRHCGCHNCFL